MLLFRDAECAKIFLDEPSSGLDSANALMVMECLVRLAKNYQRTVIFTIHQPRSNIVQLFDRLLLLSCGDMIYSGPAQETLVHYLTTIGHPCPIGFNIADYISTLNPSTVSLTK